MGKRGKPNKKPYFLIKKERQEAWFVKRNMLASIVSFIFLAIMALVFVFSIFK